MLLDNLMEDKQLNFNQPLLSVRRYSSTSVSEKDEGRNTKSFLPSVPRPPPYKSELKSGPVRNAGAVPFVWEQSPGRPKDESKLLTHNTHWPPTAPKLPPGRLLKASQQDSDNNSVSPTVNKSQQGNAHSSQSIPAQDEQTKGFECFEDAVEEEDASDSGDDEEVFVDARDTLSRTESFFVNCSVSGISGFDDPEVKPSGTFSADPQTRDFMIGRFLPAAKAMVSETPQYAPKKQPIIQDQPRHLKKVVNGDNRPQLRYGPSFVQHYSQSLENGEEESDDDYDENGSLPTKVCGLLPRFCLKGSFCLLNPLPGMSVRTKVPMSPVSRGQTKSSSASSCSKTENEQSSFDVSEQRSIDGSQTTELHEEKIDLDNKQRQISSNSKKLDGPYSHRHFHGSGMSSYFNESSLSHEHRAGLGTSIEENNTGIGGFISHEKGCKSFKELLADQSSSEELCYGSPAVEKTLYIDTVHKGESPCKKPCSPHRKGLSNLRDKDNEILTEEMKENLSRDSSVLEKLSIVAEGAKLQASFQKPPDLNHLSLADEQNQKIGNKAPKTSGLDKKLHQDSISSENLEMPHKVATQIVGKQSPKSHGVNSEFLIPPPLPKSPSDSWLCRTLPSISSKNVSLHPHFGTGVNPRNQSSKMQSVDSKWETMVKTTRDQLHHLRYSEELLVPIPEN